MLAAIMLAAVVALGLIPEMNPVLKAYAASGTVTFSGTDSTNVGQIVNDGGVGSTDIFGIQLDIFNANDASLARSGSFVYFDTSLGGTNSVIVPLDATTGTTQIGPEPPYIIVIKGSIPFSFQSIYVFDYLTGESSIKFEGFLNGSSTGSVICTLDELSGIYEATFDSSNGLTASVFQNVDEVRISNQTDWGDGLSHGNWMGINNIEIGDPVQVTTNAASSITATGATLNGTVNADNDSTAVTFEYGTDTSYGSTATATPGTVTGYIDTAVSAAISGLAPTTTYHYRVVGVNSSGTLNGLDRTFTTPAIAPAVTTAAATGKTETGATLNGTVNANNASTAVTFEYGETTGYGSTATATPGTVTGLSDTPVSAAITGLAPNTTYHYRVKGVSAGGISYGLDDTFTTMQPAAMPTASVIINSGTIKKNAVITLSSEAGATIYYTTALNSATPGTPTTSTPTHVSNGGAISLPALAYGDVLKIKALAAVPGKSDSAVAALSYTVQSQTALTLTGITLSNKEYDGSTNATADFTNADLSGVIGTDSVALTGTPGASFLTAAAENGKPVTVSGYSLNGADAEYYTLDTALTGTANITKKALTLGAIGIADKVYDGNAAATVTGIPISSGIVGSDDVSVNVPLASATYDAGASIGTGKAVSVSNIQLAGADSANYSVSATGTATGKITAKTVSVNSVTIASKAYDGSTAATITGATLTGKVGSEDVTVDTTAAAATFDNPSVGNGKQVSVTGLALGGTDRANYILAGSSYTATGDITGLGTVTTPTASIADYTVVKSGATVTLTTAGSAGATLYYKAGLTPLDPDTTSSSITSGGAVTITANPGETVVLKVFGAQAGYADSSIAVFHYPIQPKQTLTVTGASATSKDYDGNDTAVISGGALAGTIVTGDDVTIDTSAVTGQFSNKNVGNGKAVTVGGYALTGADAQYYDLTQPALTADILVKNITVSSIIISDKVYDGTTAASISSVALSWKAAGDDVYALIPAATAVFSDAGTGSGKSVSVTGLELAGADAANYQLTATTTSTTGNIVPAGAVAAPSASPTADSILSGTNVSLTTATSGATIHYTLGGLVPTSSDSTYTGPIPIAGSPGTVITVKALAVKTGMSDSGIMTKQYTIAEPGSLIVSATPGDQEITLTWDAIPSTVTYAVYGSGDNYLGSGISVTGSVYGYTATGLTNGTAYTFTVKALDSEQRVTNSAQVSATPGKVPGAPTGVTATAGNGQATVSFTAPTDNGGSPITGYVVTSSPGNNTATGTGTSITVAGLTNGTAYTFTVNAVNSAGNGMGSAPSNQVTPYSPSGGGSDGGSSSTATEPSTSTGTNTGVAVLVNGNPENAGTATTTEQGGQTVTTIAVDPQTLVQKLESEGNNAVVTILANAQSDVVVGELTGDIVKVMENKEAVLEIKTDTASYRLPAGQINIDDISAQLGASVDLKDIKVQVQISRPAADTIKVVEDAASEGNFTIIAPPLEYTVTCTYDNKTVSISTFNSYVERTIAIPDGVDPSKITTGIVIDPDGTPRQVPTKITVIDGKYYAVLNSLTNSTYSVVWHPLEFKDVASHWAKGAVNDMGSRMIISGVGNDLFEPDRAITRAEFAAVIVRALGLKPGTGNNLFTDVNSADWYSPFIETAYKYGLLSGYENGTFGPMDMITREQAMTMIARAMKITGLKVDLETGGAEMLLAEFGDFRQSSEWAKESMAACVKAGIVSGNNDKNIAPKDEITRAEVAVIIRKLLQKSNLI